MAEPADIKSQQANEGGAVHYRPRGRIIPAKEVSAWRTGQSYLEAAERESERLQKEAVSAFEEAKRRGFEEGRKEGAAAAAKLLAETASRADRHLAEADRQILDLALAVVRRVLGDFDVGQLTRNAVCHALAKQRQSQHLTLYVAPEMVDELRADVDALFEPGMRHLVTVEPNTRLDQGQCRLASEIGFVDLGIDAQLKVIHQGLADGLQRQTSD